MYFSNEKLNEIYQDVIKGTKDGRHDFNPEKQIKVCSIDIRVGSTFWIAKRRNFPIDLATRNIYEFSPRRMWEKREVEEDGYIKLKPGEMLLGSTYEMISIPEDIVGKINTRSSYARLGISTACNCDLINPGYVGHIPLEITNATSNTFLIYPYMPLCQIFLMEVNGNIDSSYTSGKYKSKYMDDDGGPSRWWRDELVEKISTTVFNTKISDIALHKLRDVFENIDDEGLYRFEVFSNTKVRRYSNSDDLLTEFARAEKKLAFRYKMRKGLSYALSIPLLLFSVQQIQDKVLLDAQTPDMFSYIAWLLTLVFVPLSIWYTLRKNLNFYDQK